MSFVVKLLLSNISGTHPQAADWVGSTTFPLDTSRTWKLLGPVGFQGRTVI